ncbi:MAG TPA: tyrosine--tRNA ligase [Lentisphaeria bacterium]|nr:tyrosine--tRNA ligase [Lentisphaeria bacterium]HCG51316.1 tyrosine--tRNA ligase [Lentisphaeria bacterium]
MSSCPFEDLKVRGFIYQNTSEDAIKKLLSEEKVYYYVGFDPTGDSLHVGHLLPVMAMRRLQQAGHVPIVMVGGATGQIGDPSGKSEARVILSKEVVAHNAECIRKQLSRFISEDNAIFVNNAEWFNNMFYLDFLRDIGSKFSVNKMLTAESVKMRLETGLSFLEFNYMILQAYDFYMLNKKFGCKLEMGGQDQWGNIVAGTELVRRLSQQEVHGITMPLLINSSTGQKFGKSVGGAVWLDKNKTSVFDYYQFWRNTDDADVQKLMLYFTALPVDEIRNICSASINRAKEILAFEATALAHSGEEAAKAYLAAGAKFGFSDKENKIPTSSAIAKINTDEAVIDDLPTYELTLPAEGIWFPKLMAEAGLCKSNGEARRLIQGGGAYLNDQRISDPDFTAKAADFPNGSAIVKAGKKNIKRIVLK